MFGKSNNFVSHHPFLSFKHYIKCWVVFQSPGWQPVASKLSLQDRILQACSAVHTDKDNRGNSKGRHGPAVPADTLSKAPQSALNISSRNHSLLTLAFFKVNKTTLQGTSLGALLLLIKTVMRKVSSIQKLRAKDHCRSDRIILQDHFSFMKCKLIG